MVIKADQIGRATTQALRDLDEASQAMMDALDRVGEISPKELSSALASASKEVEPMAQQMLAKNYGSSSLGVKTGKLMQAVRNSDFRLKLTHGAVRWFARLPSGFEKAYKNGNFYAAAASHIYGSMRGGTMEIAHKKQKREEGRKKAGNLIKKRAELKNFMGKRKMKEAGGMTYIPPKEFYFLTGGDIAKIKQRVFEIVTAWLDTFAMKQAA